MTGTRPLERQRIRRLGPYRAASLNARISVMALERHQLLDVVEFSTGSGRWAAGTIGTVVEADDLQALVEINDDAGRALDFVALPQEAFLPHPTPGSWIVAGPAVRDPDPATPSATQSPQELRDTADPGIDTVTS
jgi:hypothetical protein